MCDWESPPTMVSNHQQIIHLIDCTRRRFNFRPPLRLLIASRKESLHENYCYLFPKCLHHTLAICSFTFLKDNSEFSQSNCHTSVGSLPSPQMHSLQLKRRSCSNSSCTLFVKLLRHTLCGNCCQFFPLPLLVQTLLCPR